jgi:acetyl esterase/lipase
MSARCFFTAIMMGCILLAACGTVEPTARPAPSNLPEPEPTATDIAPTAAPTPEPLPSPSPIPTEMTVEAIRDISYVPNGNRYQKLDIYLPGGAGPHPTLLAIHGGGSDKLELSRVGRYFAERGYAFVSINHRIMPQDIHPAPSEDAFCALAWIFANRDAYGFDPERAVALGHSSGGTLAAFLATVDDPKPFLEGCPHPFPESDWLQGAVAFTGVFDYASTSGSLKDYFAEYLGQSLDQAPEIWSTASPITWVDGADPPFLLIHGKADRNIDPSHSQAFAQALEEAGIMVELVLVPDADHGQIIRSEELFETVIAFLEEILD